MTRLASVPPAEIPGMLRRVEELARKAPTAVSCIGSRELTADQLAPCRAVGRRIASVGAYIISGNAKGADQAYQEGAAEIAPRRGVLYLPWASYEKEALRPECHVRIPPYPVEAEEAAAERHPSWERLSRGARGLHVRSIMIVRSAAMCIAWPGPKPGVAGPGWGCAMPWLLENP